MRCNSLGAVPADHVSSAKGQRTGSLLRLGLVREDKTAITALFQRARGDRSHPQRNNLDGTTVLNAAIRTVTFTPADGLAYETRYTVKIASKFGSGILSDVAWSSAARSNHDQHRQVQRTSHSWTIHPARPDHL